MKWINRIELKSLMTEKEAHTSIQSSMNKIAKRIKKEVFFMPFDVSLFSKIPKGDDIFKPVDYANKLIDRLYDFADEHRIWIK